MSRYNFTGENQGGEGSDAEAVREFVSRKRVERKREEAAERQFMSEVLENDVWHEIMRSYSGVLELKELKNVPDYQDWKNEVIADFFSDEDNVKYARRAYLGSAESPEAQRQASNQVHGTIIGLVGKHPWKKQ